MEKFSIGDKVQIIHHRETKFVGKVGTIVYIGCGYNPKIHAFRWAPYFNAFLDNGMSAKNLRDWQLRSLQDTRRPQPVTERQAGQDDL